MENEKRITTVAEIMDELTFLKRMLEKNAFEDAKQAETQGDCYFEGRFRGSSFGFRLSAQWLDDIIQKYAEKE